MSTVARSRSDLVSTIVVAVFGTFTLFSGFWSLIDASSFFDNVGEFAPYNGHYVRDVGAFQIGIGAALLAALAWRDDAILAALCGGAAGAIGHEIAHIADAGDGGRDSDPVTLGIIAAIVTCAFFWRLRARYTTA